LRGHSHGDDAEILFLCSSQGQDVAAKAGAAPSSADTRTSGQQEPSSKSQQPCLISINKKRRRARTRKTISRVAA
jgi:hypothetical protein